MNNDEGLKLGRQIGAIAVKELKKQQDEHLKPIDRPYKENLQALLMPPPYKQVIEFDFKNQCTSLLRSSFQDS